MKYVDTHVHLNDKVLLSHIDEVISDALSFGVSTLICVGWDVESSKKAIELAHSYDFVYAIIGFHPCNIKGYNDEEYNWLEKNALDDKVVGIGEIGYDLHWDDTTLEEQTYAFKKQIEIALRVNKPISIHSRDACQLTFDLLSSYFGKVKGVLHAYSGSYEMAKEYIKNGFYLGVGGVVTFKNASKLIEVVENTPLEYIISETDSPYLAPTPHRGKENGPKYIPLIVDKIAQIKELSTTEVAKILESNTRRLFKI